MTVHGGPSTVNSRDLHATLEAQMQEQQAVEHLRERDAEAEAALRDAHPLVRLLIMLRLEALLDADAVEETVQRIKAPATEVVVSSLLRSFTTTNPSSEPVNEEARRQMVFFCNSMHNRRLERPPTIVEMRSLTAFTPHFAEEITYSMEALQIAGDDNASLLTILKSLTPDEWANLCERVDDLESHSLQERRRVSLGPTKLQAQEDREGEMADAEHSRPVELAVQEWASDRSQLLGRTVRGVIRTAQALKVLALMEGVPQEHVDEVVDSKFEYLVTCQIYGKMKNSDVASDQFKAQSIDALRSQFPRSLRVAYVEHDEAKSSFSSVLLGCSPSDPNLMLYKIQLPGNPIIGEGKPENQNHAIIFARGEYLQTLDMNQDMYLSEAFKTRNMLELFRGDVRVVGFREQIFSASSGLVASFAASSEFVFGTAMQRFMAWPLKVRLHYGHPDVWDKVWAITNGGVSKASRTLHVSEDIFGGANVILRGGAIDYTEFVHCGKARDITFTGINSFEQKISGGNALQCASRDMSRLGSGLDFFRLLSLYATSIGFFLTASLVHAGVVGTLVALTSLALCGAETFFPEDDQPFDMQISTGERHVYSAEFVIQLGFTRAWPLFVELWVEVSFWHAIKSLVLDVLQFKHLFTIFTERTRDFNFDRGVQYAAASYISTGRTFSSLTSNFVHLYHLYAASHFYFALKLGALATMYGCVTTVPEYYLLATWGIWLMVISLMLSPWFFNPQSFNLSALQAYFHEWLMWLGDEPGIANGMGSWRVWHTHSVQLERHAPASKRAFTFFTRQLWVGLLFITCIAGLQGHTQVEKQNPFPRSLLLVGNGIVFLALAVVFYALTGARVNVVQVFLPGSRWGSFVCCWVLRVLFILLHSALSLTIFSDYVIRGSTNGFIFFFSGSMLLSLAVQLAGQCLAEGPARTKGRSSRRAFKALRKVGDTRAVEFWYRELDVVVGTVILAALFVLALLPLSALHSKLLFNRGYAAAIGALNRRNQLIHNLFAVNLRWLLGLPRHLLASVAHACCSLFGSAPIILQSDSCEELEAPTLSDLPLRPSQPGPPLRIKAILNNVVPPLPASDLSAPLSPFLEPSSSLEAVARGPCHSAAATTAATLDPSARDDMLSSRVLSHLESRKRMLRGRVYPVANELTALFGFQSEQVDNFTVEGQELPKTVPSNLDNQVDHICSLLQNIMDRQGYSSFPDALNHAVATLHMQLFDNYGRWLRHLHLDEGDTKPRPGSGQLDLAHASKAHTTFGSLSQSNTWAFVGPWEFDTIEQEQAWLCTAQLHQIVLYLLIYGEAANLRFLPELLCFVFFCASNALALEPSMEGLKRGDLSRTTFWAARISSTAQALQAMQVSTRWRITPHRS